MLTQSAATDATVAIMLADESFETVEALAVADILFPRWRARQT